MLYKTDQSNSFIVMKKVIVFFGSIVVVLLSWFFLAFTKKKEDVRAGGNGFAVVDLFTSEGCSSCPPADEAVAQLAKDFPKNVYVLGYHVDYWNYIGWTDAFSKASFSDRQRQYSAKLNLDGIYTPQVIVNGRKEMVGSNSSLMQSTIKNELGGSASLPVTISAKNQSNQSIQVTYDAGDAPDCVLNIALVQLKGESSVKRGENKGHVLHHIDIVRDLKTIPGKKKINGTISFSLPGGVPVTELKVVGFLQNKSDWKIIGAGESAL